MWPSEQGSRASYAILGREAMGSLYLAVFWASMVMLACLLYRGWKRSLLREYPSFYVYIACVMVSAAVPEALSMGDVDRYRFVFWYQMVYWSLEAASAILGFGVTWEIYRVVLAPYSGVRRMARLIPPLLFFFVLARGMAKLLGRSDGSFVPITLELEGNLRILQLLLLLMITGFVALYRTPMSRNTKALLLGYGLFIGSNVITLHLRAEWGLAFQHWWEMLQPLEYCVTLLVWCVGMWSYAPNPDAGAPLEAEYSRVAAQTSRDLERLRAHVNQSWRA